MQNGSEPNKYGFALHTSSPQLGLALKNFAGESRSQSWNLGRDLSTHLHQHLAEFLKPQTWADLAFIAVAKGPGSFTSTRIGVVTARTLAQQLDIPLFAISTLAAVAGSHPYIKEKRFEEDVMIALQMPAQRGQLFTAVYQIVADAWGMKSVLPDAVMTPDNWQQALDTLEMPYQLIDVPTDLGFAAMGVLELAYLEWQQGKRPHWSQALPFYGQHPVDK
ncbi:MAG TPA: tRNA (adenosine(37)-N6)-threonylcarbamoyltransferase complex dimerization subunit type 1 TsaB [Coleofasciculaceae cyanobacterium]